MKIKFDIPIARWDEGAPLGNGLLGAILWGHERETYRDWETDRKSTRLNSSH